MPEATRSPSREESHNLQEIKEDEIQQDENLYDDDDSSGLGHQNREQEGSPIIGLATESLDPTLDEMIIASTAYLASCKAILASTACGANKVRKQYKILDEKLMQSLTKLLTENTTRNGNEATVLSIEAKADACETFGREKAERIRNQFREPLDKENAAEQALEIAEANYSALVERNASQEIESDEWEI